MKKISAVIILMSFFGILTFSGAFAVVVGGEEGGGGAGPADTPCPPDEICNPLKAKSFEELINIVINFVFWAGIVVAPLMILVAAFVFLFAAGDPTRVKLAWDIIKYTAVGLGIIILAKGLVAVLKSVLGV